MSGSYAKLADSCPDENLPFLRELLSFDVICPLSCIFVRDQYGSLRFANDHSPMHWSRQSEWPWVLREGDFKPGQKVLDIGGGHSVLKYPIALRTCGGFISLDINQEFINKTQPIIDGMGFGDRIKQVQGDAVALPFADETFDRVISVSVLEHIPGKHLQCVEEAVRVLRPGGIALITFAFSSNSKTRASSFSILVCTRVNE